MQLDQLTERIPDHAKDLRLNLRSVLQSEHLTPRQLWGTALASAAATRHAALTAAIAEAAREHLDEGEERAALTAHALMGMNNIYYRFVHLSTHDAYQRLPARLRMQGLARPGVPTEDFELWALAVSAIHGCGLCLDSHDAKLRQAGVAPEAVQDAVRIASVLHGIATTLDAQDALRDLPHLEAA